MSKPYEEPYCDTCENTGVDNQLCPNCAGSGEGMYNGSTCTACRGSGTEEHECPDCDRILDWRD